MGYDTIEIIFGNTTPAGLNKCINVVPNSRRTVKFVRDVPLAAVWSNTAS